jgi:ferritin-like metal-binding protein YciE
MNDLKDLYLDQLDDLYSACGQSRDATVELEKAATNATLKEALHKGHHGISAGMDVMAGILRDHGKEPGAEHCMGMEGLVKEARKHALEEEFGDDDVRDAMIISQYQRMAHYAIAGYGTAKAFAKRLGFEEDVDLLDRHLGNTYDGDEKMTELAQGGINDAAAA